MFRLIIYVLFHAHYHSLIIVVMIENWRNEFIGRGWDQAFQGVQGDPSQNAEVVKVAVESRKSKKQKSSDSTRHFSKRAQLNKKEKYFKTIFWTFTVPKFSGAQGDSLQNRKVTGFEPLFLKRALFLKESGPSWSPRNRHLPGLRRRV